MKLETSNLSFCRSLEPGEGMMYGVRTGAKPPYRGEALVPVAVETKTVRGTISNYIAENKTLNPENANPQSIDVALMPPGCDRLAIGYALTVVPGSVAPHASNNTEIAANFKELIEKYRIRGGYRFLAARYLWNVANGRPLWRNALIMTDKVVEIVVGDEQPVTITLDKTPLDLRTYPGDQAMEEAFGAEAFNRLADRVAGALSGEGPAVRLDVLMHGQVGAAQQVYPSQEFVREEEAEKTKRKNDGHGIGKVLSSTRIFHKGQEIRQATLHTQKIGNALRWIDEWHGKDEHGAVPVDPYGALTMQATCLRPNKGKTHFYAYIKKPALIENVLDSDASLDDEVYGPVHYFFAMLVRGGVFGTKD